MASNTTPSSAAHPSPDPDLANLQSLFRAALAQGIVSPEKEIERRAELVSLLIREYERGAQRNPQYLRDAIEHSEAVLRRLPRDSLKPPQHLSRLSYACMSEYAASQSRRAIDEAVRCGRLAREEAVATGTAGERSGAVLRDSEYCWGCAVASMSECPYHTCRCADEDWDGGK